MYTKMVKFLVFIMLCSMINALSDSNLIASSQVQFFFQNTAETTPGGIRCNDVIGRDYTLQVLENTTSFVWNIFQQQNPNQRKDVRTVGLVVAEIDDHYNTKDGIVTLSENCCHHYPGDLRKALNSFLLHETAHIWQWNGKGQAPTGLIEGIADYVTLKAGHAPADWVKPGQGDRWDHGNDVTARFLDYCNDLGNGNFVANLNEKMRDGYSDSFFEELLGKNVETLWADYKAKFGN